jgi:hypothetical protein
VDAAVNATGVEHICIKDGRSHLRLDVLSGSMLDGAAYLQTPIKSDAYLGDQITGLQQLYTLCTRGRLLQKPFVKPQRRVQIITALRVHDARVAGASQREIAIALFGAERVSAEWNGASDAMRSHVRRSITLAKHMAAGGYQTLLGGSRFAQLSGFDSSLC